jgi:cobaltochelatase CobS
MAYATRLEVGTKIATRFSAGEIVGGCWATGNGSKRKWQYTIRWDSGRTSTVGQKRLTLMTRGIPQGQSEQAVEQAVEQVVEQAVEQTQAHEVIEGRVYNRLPGDIADKGLAGILAEAIGPYVTGKLDRDEVMSLIDERMQSLAMPRRCEVVSLDGLTRDMGVQHANFPAVLRLVSAGLHVWLVGPAGSGKTSIAAAVADALDLPHYAQSVCQQTSKGDLLGYRAAGTGEYVRTDLREAFEHGGVFLLDEVDAGNPNVMVVMNAILANNVVSFPDGMIRKHANFRLLAGANTIGMGANTQYVGRNKLDEATRDRFVLMNLPYDPSIEAAMCGVGPEAFGESDTLPGFEFHDTSDTTAVELRVLDVCRTIVRVRKAIEATGIRHIVSPRASKAACTMLRLGFSVEDTLDMAVWKGLDSDSIRKIKAHC